jgi:hypothetical protein
MAGLSSNTMALPRQIARNSLTTALAKPALSSAQPRRNVATIGDVAITRTGTQFTIDPH